MKNVYLVLIGLFIQLNMYSQTSTQDGNWMNPTTWDCFCVPDPYSNSIDIVIEHTVTADFFGGNTYFSGGSLEITSTGSLIQTGAGNLFMKNAITTVSGTLDMRRIAIENGSAVYNGIIQNCDSLWNDSCTVINNGIATAYDHQVYKSGDFINNGTLKITNNMNIMGDYTNSISGIIDVTKDFSNLDIIGNGAIYTNNGSHNIGEDFINASNDTIKGNGTFCIRGLSTNQGVIEETVDFSTPTSSFNVNTGTVASSVTFTSGSCNFSESNSKPSFSVNIYPNPVQNSIYIYCSLPINEISIIDINGKAVLKQQLSSNQIDLSTLKSGIYFIKIQSNNGQVVMKKLIKI